jgi:endo-1,4-beta-D-glucanase Y
MLFASLMLFVCLLSYSASAEKIVHKAWHEYIDVFSVDGKVIDIRLGKVRILF